MLVAITIAWPESVTDWPPAVTGIECPHGAHRPAATRRAGQSCRPGSIAPAWRGTASTTGRQDAIAGMMHAMFNR